MKIIIELNETAEGDVEVKAYAEGHVSPKESILGNAILYLIDTKLPEIHRAVGGKGVIPMSKPS